MYCNVACVRGISSHAGCRNFASLKLATVFINYRRIDSDVSAGDLYDTLKSRLPDPRLFMDVDDISPGKDFGSVLRAALAETDLLIVVIGPAWLTVHNDNDVRRLEEQAISSHSRLPKHSGAGSRFCPCWCKAHGCRRPLPCRLHCRS